MTIALRPYQEQALADVRAAMRRHKRVLLQSPTGSGKTVMFAHLAQAVAAKGKRVAILAHRVELVNQAQAKLRDLGIEPAIIASGSREVMRSPVAVASVQTLARRLAHYAGTFDLLVLDEAHHATAATWGVVLAAFPDAYVLGVTATPARSDGRGLGDVFGELVLGPSVRSLIEAKHLADYVAFTSPHGGPDLSGIKTKMGDYDLAALADVMSKRQLVGDAVEHYARHCHARPAVAFCVSVKHSELVAQQFRDAGYRSVSVDGKLDAAERAHRIGGLAAGRLDVLTSCDLISEGLDVPGISAAILLRPTKSLGLYLQQVGRAMRPKADGSRAVILDHAGNVHAHGLPCADREWSLAAKKRSTKKGTAPVKTCLECYAVCSAACRECPQCGAEFEVEEREVETAAGELVQIDRRFFGEDGRPTVERRRGDIEAALGRCEKWDDLEALRKALGFKVGWSQAVAKSRGWLPIRNKAGFAFKYMAVRKAA